MTVTRMLMAAFVALAGGIFVDHAKARADLSASCAAQLSCATDR